MLPNLVDSADVWMVQRRSCFGFTLKPSQRLRLLRYFIRQKLKSYKAMQGNIFSLIDHTHPATTQLLHNPVMRDSFADHGAESYCRRDGKSMKVKSLGCIWRVLLAKNRELIAVVRTSEK